MWSGNKKEWGDNNPDALSMTFSTTATDHTFRTGLFADKPRVVNEEPTKANQDEWHTVKCLITQTKAKYFVDGSLFAECHYAKGDVPQKGHFGFGVYDTSENKTIEDIVIEKYKPTAEEWETARTPEGSDDEVMSAEME